MHTAPRSRHVFCLSAGLAGAALLATTFVLTGQLDAQGVGSAQLLPVGEFAARDGRPGPGKKWRISNAQGRALAARINGVAAQTPMLFDYEHQTLTAAEKGHLAPAAGFADQVEWRDDVGLYARVKWTAAARGRIDAGEYRYISPVIVTDDDGVVTDVLMGSLVNYPALLGMEAAVASLNGLTARHAYLFHPHLQQEPPMNREALCALLGLPADATDAQINAAVTALAGELPGLRTAQGQVVALQARPEVPARLAVVLGIAPTAGEAEALSAVASLRTANGGSDGNTLAAIAALQGELAALRATVGGNEVTALVDQAVADKKLLPAMKAWATDLGKKDIAALKAYIAAAPAIDGLGGQSGGQERGGATVPQTSALAAQVMAAFGLTPEQFAKGAKAKA